MEATKPDARTFPGPVNVLCEVAPVYGKTRDGAVHTIIATGCTAIPIPSITVFGARHRFVGILLKAPKDGVSSVRTSALEKTTTLFAGIGEHLKSPAGQPGPNGLIALGTTAAICVGARANTTITCSL
jgi:hypothetical protein